ncbi:LuxR C-terminal-related transcriptional regulator [Xylanimonas sp. McL0601]|uniref:LuxR C-terminal-related transcriptional regulator n=1 Tax=Xylanimonas sp. McL0601 TaxID=3414739 RepID=UPI003CEBC093
MVSGTAHPFSQARSRIRVPSLPTATLERPRLRALITDAVDHHQVTLVVGPAGYGKTSTLADWAHHQGRPVAWLSIDPFDNDLTRLHRGLLESLRVAASEHLSRAGARRTTLGRLRTPGLGERLNPEYFDALLGMLGELEGELVLVLDDVHQLRGGGVIEVLGAFTRQLPPNVRLVISARHDPALPLQRLRAAGLLGEIREEDLAFDREELHRLVERDSAAIGDDAVTDDDTATTLYRLTGGWPVAVRLILVAMSSPLSPTPLAALSEATRPLADYLVEEVLRGLPEDLRMFVLRATSTGTINPELAAVVWDRDDGPELLDRCLHLGLFLAPAGTPGSTPSYQWHTLFAAECQAVLRATRPDVYRAAHRALAVALGATDIAAAIEHADAAQDGELAASLLRERWADLLIAGEHATVRRLLQGIPTPWRDGAELLVVDAAVAAVEREPAVDRLLERARELATKLPGSRRRVVEATATLIELFFEGAASDVRSALGRGAELLEHADEMSPAEQTLAHFLVGRAEAFNAYDDQRALGHLSEGARLAAERGFTAIEVACLSESTVPLYGSGEVDAAWALANQVVSRVRAYGWESPNLLAAPLVAKGLISYGRDDLDDARVFLEEGLNTLPKAAHAARVRAAVGLMVTCLALDDAAGLGRARARALETEPGEAASSFATDATAVIGALAQALAGDLERAVAQLEDAHGPDRRPIVRVWEAEIYRLAGRLEDARAALDRIPESVRSLGISVDFGLSAALIANAQGETEAAHRNLERALDDAETRGIRRPFAERRDAAPLLSEHLAWATRHEALVIELLHRPVDVHTARRGPIHWELSEREREILLYMRSPLSAAEIARALFVSINTVKTHQRSIYRKLGVTGRHEALRAAADRGLLS